MKLAAEVHRRVCKRCHVSRPIFEFARCGKSSYRSECEVCVAGRHRFAALARSRPLLSDLRGDVRECAVWWEIARMALHRALKPELARHGLRIEWTGVTGCVVPFRKPPL